ncbi:hypothetical protein [Parenemella sanctibonifatiensis]|uniref:Transglutaminase-like domain-containing protein n=1 Tax=Parenemella sanctibonifatiensis TaxID=2016505 RepID=A0A255EDV4_9ACTN|nr:hypothetical protein [Parenemella sanctibonifatiensis]OYN87592.1 hypothetical protein CGZ92_07780 [Parenemella sanctibonifatiensis]
MGTKKWGGIGVGSVLGAALVFFGVPRLLAPKPVRHYPEGVDTLAEAVSNCRSSGLSGWELVAYAQHLVARKFGHYSTWHLWETSPRAFRNGRGNARRYNGALAMLLTEVGFDVVMVHAARVRQPERPWWSVGHTWLWVTHDGTRREVCARCLNNEPGKVDFEPLTRVQPERPWTGPAVEAALRPFVAAAVWRATLTGRPVPDWVYKAREDEVRPGGE